MHSQGPRQLAVPLSLSLGGTFIGGAMHSALNRYLALALLAFSPSALAEDGLVIQFTISEHEIGSDDLQTYTNAILMRFDEEVSFDLADLYVLKIRSQADEAAALNLLITLKDMIDGKPYYVGAKPVSVDVGKKAQVEFQEYGRSYTISLDTSYGEIPEKAGAQPKAGHRNQ